MLVVLCTYRKNTQKKLCLSILLHLKMMSLNILLEFISTFLYTRQKSNHGEPRQFL